MSDKISRVGVIGVGAMGKNHARIYSELPDAELVGVADINEKLAKETAKNYNTKAFKDYKKLLDCGLDIVSIAVPTIHHEKVCLDAIKAATNVLVEKPIASTLESAGRIIDAANDSKLKLMVGHTERFNPAVSKLKEILDSNQLGDIISITTKRVGPFNLRVADIGIILDIGIHDLDIISYLYNEEVLTVYTIASKNIHSYEDYASIMMHFNNGRAGVVEVNWLTPQKIRKLTAIGTNGVAYLDYIDQTVFLHDKEWIKEAKIIKEEPLVRELKHFIEAVQKGKRPLVTGEDGRKALKVAIASIESYEKNQIIKVS